MRHPVLGFPSKSAAAWALKRDGRKVDEIATVLGVNPASVGNLIRMGRMRDGEADTIHYTEQLAGPHRYRLRVEAAKRGMTTRQLVNAVLAAVCEKKKFFPALLDDGGEK